MSKLRSDSVFSQLTAEQVDLLEEWLFEENLSYKEALERVRQEFHITGSLTGLRRFYGRLAGERSQESITELVKACTDALATAGKEGVLQAGMLILATKVGVQMLVESPGKVREFTALLRAITSAQALEMKRREFQRAWDRREAREMEEKEEAERKQMLEQSWRAQDKELAEERKARRAAKAAESAKKQAQSLSEAASPKVQMVQEKVEPVEAKVEGAEGSAKDQAPSTREAASAKIQTAEEEGEVSGANEAMVNLEVVKEEPGGIQVLPKAVTAEEAARRGGCFRIIGG